MKFPTPIETTVYHVGAAGGIHRSWEGYPGILNYVCFDPEESAAAELKEIAGKSNEAGQVRIFVEKQPVFSRKGEIDFHIYDVPMLSSVFLLDEQITHRYRYSKVRHVKTLKMTCATIDDIAFRRGDAPDSLTIDAQGAGLAILEGATKALGSSIMSVRVEVEFIPLYRNQHLFDEVWTFMRSRGFRLVRLEKCGSGETGFSTDAGPFSSGMGDGVPAWADAIFLKVPAASDWSTKHVEESAAFLFKFVLFALSNRIGSVGLDLVYDMAQQNRLSSVIEALCDTDRELLMNGLLAQFEQCEASTWERQEDRRTVFRLQQQRFRAILKNLLIQGNPY